MTKHPFSHFIHSLRPCSRIFFQYTVLLFSSRWIVCVAKPHSNEVWSRWMRSYYSILYCCHIVCFTLIFNISWFIIAGYLSSIASCFYHDTSFGLLCGTNTYEQNSHTAFAIAFNFSLFIFTSLFQVSPPPREEQTVPLSPRKSRNSPWPLSYARCSWEYPHHTVRPHGSAQHPPARSLVIIRQNPHLAT